MILWFGCFFDIAFFDMAFSTKTATNSHRVLESLKAGKRLPEARYSNLKVAAKGQGSVYKLYSGGVASLLV